MHLTNFHFYLYKNYHYSKPVKGLRGCGVGYGFSFNGMERDNETYGEGNEYDFGARIYTVRLGRWLSLDPLEKKYPYLSPYNFCNNSPIIYMDFDGRDFGYIIDHNTKTITIISTYYTVKNDKARAESAVNHWNDASYKFSYDFTDNNGQLFQYDIVFKLEVDATSLTQKEAIKKGQDDKTGNSLNYYSNCKDVNTTKKYTAACYTGITYFGGQIRVNKVGSSQFLPNFSDEHEIGHTLGLGHGFSGPMEKYNTRAMGSQPVTADNLQGILNFAKISYNSNADYELGNVSVTQKAKNLGNQSRLPAEFLIGTVNAAIPNTAPSNLPVNYPRTEAVQGGF